MKVLVLGAGAIGGYFGGRLVQAGVDVTFLVRPARKALLQAKGLRILSVVGDFSTPVKAMTAEELDGPYDVVLLTCKSYDLESAISAIRPAIGQDTAILPLLNGLAHMDRLDDEFGKDRMFGGIARILVALGEEGEIIHTGPWQQITFGEQTGGLSERALALQSAFPAATVQAEAVPDAMQHMWDKAVQMAVAAGMACLMRGNISEIAAVSGGTESLRQCFELCARVAEAEGFPIGQPIRDMSYGVYSDLKNGFTPSMYRDLLNGNVIEGEQIVGHMLERARKHGIEATQLELMTVNLGVYERRRKASG